MYWLYKTYIRDRIRIISRSERSREIFALLKSNAPSAQTTKVFLVLKATRELIGELDNPYSRWELEKTIFTLSFVVILIGMMDHLIRRT